MFVKARAIFIFSLLMLHSSVIKADEINCDGHSFYCPTINMYMPCLYDEVRNITVTVSDRSEACDVGLFCDVLNDRPCYAEETTVPTETSTVTDPTTTTAPPAMGALPGYTCAGSGLYPHPTDCRRYILCVVSGSTYINSQRQCRDEQVYHTDFGGCRADTTPCDNMEFKCVKSGRFVDPLNPSKYIWCLKVNGAFQALKYTCPAGTIYNEAPTKSTEASTIAEPTATTTASPGLAGYTCAGIGRYPHPTDCRRYIFCILSGSTYRISQHQCSNELVYHPDIDGCKLDTTPCDNMDFKCVKSGRFANPLNPSKYVWCLEVFGNGVFQAVKYSCPVGKIYDGDSACVEPIVINGIETLAADESLNVYRTIRRSLSVQDKNEADEERYLESDEMVADRISLNSNEDASVYVKDEKYSRL